MDSGADDLYAVLRVPSDATRKEITRAYHRLLRDHHPDLRSDAATGPGADAGRPARAAADDLRGIMRAYAVLDPPESRAAYDRSRAEPEPPPANNRGAGGYPIPVRIHRRDPDDQQEPDLVWEVRRPRDAPLIEPLPGLLYRSPSGFVYRRLR